MGSRRDVLRNMFQSVFHPHKWERSEGSLPQKQLEQFYLDSLPPCFKVSQLRKQDL